MCVEGDGYGGVAEHLGDDLRVDAFAEKKRVARVPEIAILSACRPRGNPSGALHPLLGTARLCTCGRPCLRERRASPLDPLEGNGTD